MIGIRKPKYASLHQLEAIRGALPTGFLKRLPGGFWVPGDYPIEERGHTPNAWLAGITVQAVVFRGWFKLEGKNTANLTDIGREQAALLSDVDTSKAVKPHNRIASGMLHPPA